MKLTDSKTPTQPKENKAVSTLTAILEQGGSQRDILCDLPQSVTLEFLAGLRLIVGFTGDKPSVLIQSSTPITSKRLESLQVVLEDVMMCYCSEVKKHSDSSSARHLFR